MACAIDPQHIGHDRLRFGLMSMGQRMRDAREQPEGFPEARDGLVEFCRAELLSHLERDDAGFSRRSAAPRDASWPRRCAPRPGR